MSELRRIRRIVALVFVGGLILSAIILAHAQWDYAANRLPKTCFRGVCIRYRDGAVAPWVGLERAIDSMHDVIHAWYGERGVEKILSRIIIEVAPLHADLRANGREANGTVDDEGPPLGPRYHALIVRQLPGGPCASALMHEMSQHVVPLRLRGENNAFHSDPTLRELEQSMLADCFAKAAAEISP